MPKTVNDGKFPKVVPDSRRNSRERQKKGFRPRKTDITLPGHRCHGTGHDFIFARFDYYGYCPRCGDECF